MKQAAASDVEIVVETPTILLLAKISPLSQVLLNQGENGLDNDGEGSTVAINPSSGLKSASRRFTTSCMEGCVILLSCGLLSVALTAFPSSQTCV